MRIQIDKDTTGWNDPAWAVLVIGIVAALSVNYFRPVLSLIPACPFHALTGMPCLTCGSTRAFTALVDGELFAAVRLQPLFVIACLIASASGLRALFAMIMGRRIAFELTKQDRLLIRCALIALLLINWAYLVGAGI